ncbi:MAG TPA: hypothetical protein VEB66_14785 [Opitutaceae bacterium]|nr:hypothetical protein [Opitutaceae bacterium]
MKIASLRLCLALCLAALTAGCLQIEHIVTLKPDGSGALSIKMVMPKAFVDQMKSMGEGVGQPGADGKANPFDLLDEKKLREDAGKLGEGVEYVGADRITGEAGEGYIARYTFKDINKLLLDQNPTSVAPGSGGSGPSGGPEVITFAFTPGRTSKLVITSPEMKMPDGDKDPAASADEKPAEGAPAEAEAEADAAAEEMAATMMQQIFKDMKVVVAIEFDGRIVETNASHVSGNRVTVMALDFNKLLADPAKLKSLSKSQPKTMEEMKAMLAGIDGIVVETKPSVAVEFR